jgi:hypothetical protein
MKPPNASHPKTKIRVSGVKLIHFVRYVEPTEGAPTQKGDGTRFGAGSPWPALEKPLTYLVYKLKA